MNDPQDRLIRMIAKIRSRGMRVTPQRMAILKILASSKGHPSVERIYEQLRKDMPTISLATVYKTVHLLKELGEVLELGFGDDSNRYDGNIPFPHPHLVCVYCREIINLEIDNLIDMPLAVSRETGYQIVNHRLDFFGVCPRCQESMPKSA
jgi:Fur family peroxide stress response transcriptional regulator